MNVDGLSERGCQPVSSHVCSAAVDNDSLTNKDKRDVTTVVIPPLLVSFGVFIDIDRYS
jgi:hypothetical protein